MFDINLKNSITLSFKNNYLEKEFQNYYNIRFLKQFKFALALAIFLYGIFSFLDVFLYRDIGYYFLKIRLFIVCPYFAFIVLFLLNEKFLKYIQLILLSSVFVSASGVLEMIRILYMNHYYSNIYFNGLIIIVMYGYIFLRIRFVLALIGGLFTLVGYEIIAFFLTKIPLEIVITNNFFFLTFTIIGIIVNYNLELDTRKYFLLLKELNKEKEVLKRKNLILDKLAHIDPLTGIPNKRFFYENLRLLLKNSTNENYLSLLIIDVDFFKKYNDYYGHIRGDKCLKIIAKTLKKLIRNSKDILARFGGEEFVVLLPNTDKETSKLIGERIRTKIRDLKLKHEASEIDNYVTVSIGGVTSTLTKVRKIEDLIKNADKALYEAKNSGRNKICFYEEEKNENRSY